MKAFGHITEITKLQTVNNENQISIFVFNGKESVEVQYTGALAEYVSKECKIGHPVIFVGRTCKTDRKYIAGNSIVDFLVGNGDMNE